jgi:hypothetical protein
MCSFHFDFYNKATMILLENIGDPGQEGKNQSKRWTVKGCGEGKKGLGQKYVGKRPTKMKLVDEV